MNNEGVSDWSCQVEAIYHEQSRELWALFYAHCCDAERAADAVQESFVRLFEQEPGEILDVRAWLLRVGRNWLRDVARHQKVKSRSLADPDLPKPPASKTPEELLSSQELQQQVRDGLDELREEDRTALILRYSLGWSSQKIADALESTPSAIDMRLSRARKRLGHWLENSGAHPE